VIHCAPVITENVITDITCSWGRICKYFWFSFNRSYD